MFGHSDVIGHNGLTAIARIEERPRMNPPRSNAIVFFGASGDLAYKKIFPALQATVRRGRLDIPVIGVAKSGWDLEKLKTRARESVEDHSTLEPEAILRVESSELLIVQHLLCLGPSANPGNPLTPLDRLLQPLFKARPQGRWIAGAMHTSSVHHNGHLHNP